jgi:hypothetical protein
VGDTCYDIAEDYKNKDNYSQALKWYTESYKIRRRKLGKEHPDTSATRKAMEDAYNKASLFEQ